MFNYALQAHAHTNQMTAWATENLCGFYYAYLREPIVSEDKNLGTFIPAAINDTVREDRSINHMTAIVMDVDNDGFIPGAWGCDLVNPWDVASDLEEQGLEFCLYSSHSNTRELPRFRVIISADRAMTPSEFKMVHHYVHNVVAPDAEGDDCTRKLSQPYFLYSARPEHQAAAFTDYRQGQPLDVDHILSTHQVPEEELKAQDGIEVDRLDDTNRIVNSDPTALINRDIHRRERLLSLICAMYNAGKPEHEAVERIIEYDRQYHHAGNNVHSGPYFTDYRKHPKFQPVSGQTQDQRTYELAERLVSTEYKCLARKHGPQQALSASTRRPIFSRSLT